MPSHVFTPEQIADIQAIVRAMFPEIEVRLDDQLAILLSQVGIPGAGQSAVGGRGYTPAPQIEISGTVQLDGKQIGTIVWPHAGGDVDPDLRATDVFP